MKKLVLAITMLFLTVGFAFAQTTDLQVLAVVKYNKSESITVKQLKARVTAYEKQMGRKLTADDRKKVLEALIEEKVMLQAAAKTGFVVPDSAVDQYFIQSMSQQLGTPVTEKELSEIVKQTQGITLDELVVQQVGMNITEYKAYLKNQLTIQQYVVQTKQAELQQVAPTDEEIRAFYEGNKASFVQTDMVKLFMIVVPKGDNPDAALTKANDLRNKLLDKKMTPDQFAVQSKIENSGYQAGELLLPKTEIAANSIGMTYQNLMLVFSQAEGFTSDVQETAQDYRVLAVVKKYDAKILSISDVVQPDTTITVYDYIRQNLGQQKQMQYVQIAAQELATSLNTSENVEWKKTGDALMKLLTWE